jgi:hypothetical protein
MGEKATRRLWVTAAGERIEVAAMGSAHLANAIKLLRRRATATVAQQHELFQLWQFSLPPYLRDEARSSLEALASLSVDDFVIASHPTGQALFDEAKRRNLAIGEGGQFDRRGGVVLREPEIEESVAGFADVVARARAVARERPRDLPTPMRRPRRRFTLEQAT